MTINIIVVKTLLMLLSIFLWIGLGYFIKKIDNFEIFGLGCLNFFITFMAVFGS